MDVFVSTQSRLLDLEREAEVAQSQDQFATSDFKDKSHFNRLVLKGSAIKDVVIDSSRTGLFGRTQFTFKHKIPSNPLPANSFSNGDIVGVYFGSGQNDSGNDQCCSGVVTSANAFQICLAFQESLEELNLDDNLKYNLVKLANDVTYKRLKKTLANIKDEKNFGLLHDYLLGNGTLSPPHQSLSPSVLSPDGKLKLNNAGLNSCQMEAVEFALKQRELGVIHGPPGTGKTTTVVEYILQEVAQGHKVLCCAPSNVAVDNILDKLTANKTKKVVRLGHPARVDPKLQKYSLDAIVANSEQTQLVEDVRREIDSTLAKMKGGRKKGGGGGSAKNELKELRKELREREARAVKEILTDARVVLSTLASATSGDGALKHLKNTSADVASSSCSGSPFDVAVIDECSQSMEMACWIAILQTQKVILAGDHKQLPPTIMSVDAASQGLELTLMERVVKADESKGDLVRMLTTQYRMNTKIMEWSSKTFYNSKLVADASVQSRLLSQLPGMAANEDTVAPLLMVDTTGCEMLEMQTLDEISKANEGEVGLVVSHVESLVKSGLDPSEIAVVTPYNLQVELIRLQIGDKFGSPSKLEVRSVDGFQGREKEAVVLSLVRSNSKGEVGFLKESRRLNVAVTRAKRHLCLICNAETVSHDPSIKSLIEHIEAEGEVRSAMQYQHLLSDLDIRRPEGMELVLKDEGDRAASSSKKDKTLASPRTTSASKPPKTAEDIERERKRRKAQLRRQIDKFLAQQSQDTFEFPSSLNSHERLLVHEIAEELGLGHKSVGEEKDRRIVLERRLDNALASESRVPVSEGSSEDEADELRAMIEAFAKDCTVETKEMSPTLEPHQRKAVHMIAEELGLCHESLGEGKQRRIVLTKRGEKNKEEHQQKNPKANPDNQQGGAKAKSSKSEPDKPGSGRASNSMTSCSTCLREVPKDNIELHKLRCSKPKVEPQHQSSKSGGKSKKKNQAKKEEEDIDALLESFTQTDKVCRGEGCKVGVQTLSATCKFCRLRFCLKCSMPEVHGCGDAAKQAARQQIARDGKLYAGSGRPSHLPDKAKKAALQRKMDKKLGEMNEERSKKTKKK